MISACIRTYRLEIELMYESMQAFSFCKLVLDYYSRDEILKTLVN